MGQMWKVVNLDKCEYIEPFGGGKFKEHTVWGSDFVDAVVQKLAEEWKWNRVIWHGEYGEDFCMKDHACIRTAEHYYRYVCSADKKECVDLKLYGEFLEEIACSAKWCQFYHPLPLLISEPIHLGLGDYDGVNMTQVSRWFRDRIFASDNMPSDYKSLLPIFLEIERGIVGGERS